METAFTKPARVMEFVQMTQINVEQSVLAETARIQVTTEAVEINVSTKIINAMANVHKDTLPVETTNVFKTHQFRTTSHAQRVVFIRMSGHCITTNHAETLVCIGDQTYLKLSLIGILLLQVKFR